jgi:hypothetical protein
LVELWIIHSTQRSFKRSRLLGTLRARGSEAAFGFKASQRTCECYASERAADAARAAAESTQKSAKKRLKRKTVAPREAAE